MLAISLISLAFVEPASSVGGDREHYLRASYGKADIDPSSLTLEADIALSFADDSASGVLTRNLPFSADDGDFHALALGRRLASKPFLSVELELIHLSADPEAAGATYNVSFADPALDDYTMLDIANAGPDGSLSTTAALFNLVAHKEIAPRLKGHAGLGAGAAYTDINFSQTYDYAVTGGVIDPFAPTSDLEPSTNYAPTLEQATSESWSLAFTAFIGAAFELTDQIDVFAQARYFLTEASIDYSATSSFDPFVVGGGPGPGPILADGTSLMDFDFSPRSSDEEIETSTIEIGLKFKF